MSLGKLLFGVPGFLKLLVEAKGFPVNCGTKEDNSAEMTNDTARAYVVTMLAVGAGNGNGFGPWGTNR